MKILGVKINNLTRKEILHKIEIVLILDEKDEGGEECLQVNTVNPEFILQAQKDEEFREILNRKNSLNIADGIGLKFASWWQGENLKCRWPGADLMLEVLKIANKNKQKVFLIADKNGLSSWQETARIIRKRFSDLDIDGCDIEISNKTKKTLRFPAQSGSALSGKIYDLGDNATSSHQSRINTIMDVDNLKSYIINHKSDVIFCALGSPVQEKLLQKLQNKVKLTMGVGGSFDFLTGKIKRAPSWMRVIGLEWLYRLVLEPSYRWRRIFRAVVVFPAKIIFSKDR